MGKVKGRTHIASADLKRLAFMFGESGLDFPAILEHLNTLDMVGEKPISMDTLKRWNLEQPIVSKDKLIQCTYADVMFLRGKAYWATAMCEINRSYIIERAYWWGLYISALHIMLRQALAIEAAAELPPQFIVTNLDQFYADIRAIQVMVPPLAGQEETVEELKTRMKAFEDTYGRDIKLPTETL